MATMCVSASVSVHQNVSIECKWVSVQWYYCVCLSVYDCRLTTNKRRILTLTGFIFLCCVNKGNLLKNRNEAFCSVFIRANRTCQGKIFNPYTRVNKFVKKLVKENVLE